MPGYADLNYSHPFSTEAPTKRRAAIKPSPLVEPSFWIGANIEESPRALSVRLQQREGLWLATLGECRSRGRRPEHHRSSLLATLSVTVPTPQLRPILLG